MKSNEVKLVEEYGIKSLPKLVYFRNEDPMLYTGILVHIISLSDLAEWPT